MVSLTVDLSSGSTSSSFFLSLSPQFSLLSSTQTPKCVKLKPIDRFRVLILEEKMGGGSANHGHGNEDFRYKVWSMTGGPNCRPKHWKRNTAIAMFGVFLVCIPIFKLSAKLEVSFSIQLFTFSPIFFFFF